MEDYKKAIVRIYDQSPDIIGTGFAISDTQILTCGHVVASALGIPRGKAKAVSLDFFEGDTVKVAFPKGESLKAKISFYLFEKDNRAHDIAILEYQSGEPFPENLSPIEMLLLNSPDDSVGNTWEGQGYPEGGEDGFIATGPITGQISTNGLLQLDGTGNHNPKVSPGYSGGAVYDRQAKGVIGIFKSAMKNENKQTAFAIPTNIIKGKLAEAGIDLPVTSNGPVNPNDELTLSTEQQKQLRQKMGNWLSAGNIRTACFDMGIDYEDVVGNNKTAKIESLVELCNQTGRIGELIATLKGINSYRNWEVS